MIVLFRSIAVGEKLEASGFSRSVSAQFHHMWIRFLTSYAALWIVASTAFAEQESPSSARPQLSFEQIKRIDDALQRYVDENKVAGMVGLVLRHGQPIYEKALGWADREAGRKMSVDSIFRIASQTKAITSVAVLMLVEEGKLRLDQPISDFLPTFHKTKVAVKNKNGRIALVAAKRPITIRMLLSHTAGISYGTSNEVAKLYQAKGLGPAAGLGGWYLADKDEPICTTMTRLGTLPVVSQPGTAWIYGYSSDVLGCIVEKASGMTLEHFVGKRITGPLGMNDTQFFLRPEQRERLAAVYRTNEAGAAERAPEGPNGQGDYAEGPRRNFSGGAGLTSTIRDYAKFLEMIRNHGFANGVRFLSQRSVDLLRTNQVGNLHSTNGLGYGLGFQTTDRFGANGFDSAGSYGWAGAYGTTYRTDLQRGLSLLMMVQLLPNGTDLWAMWPAIVHQALNGK